jgi:hypothetical protein
MHGALAPLLLLAVTQPGTHTLAAAAALRSSAGVPGSAGAALRSRASL